MKPSFLIDRYKSTIPYKVTLVRDLHTPKRSRLKFYRRNKLILSINLSDKDRPILSIHTFLRKVERVT